MRSWEIWENDEYFIMLLFVYFSLIARHHFISLELIFGCLFVLFSSIYQYKYKYMVYGD